MPDWMERYRDMLEADLGGNTVEELLNDTKTNGFSNVIRAALITMADSKVRLLYGLHAKGLLRDGVTKRETTCRREEFEQLVTEILVALDGWTDLPDGPTVDDAREAVMRELLAFDRLNRGPEFEQAMRETQTRAMGMSEMRLTDLQRTALANVIEPLSCVLAGKPYDGLIDHG